MTLRQKIASNNPGVPHVASRKFSRRYVIMLRRFGFACQVPLFAPCLAKILYGQTERHAFQAGLGVYTLASRLDNVRINIGRKILIWAVWAGF